MRSDKKTKRLEEQIEKIKDIVKQQIDLELELRRILDCGCDIEDEAEDETIEEEEINEETYLERRGRKSKNRMCTVDGCMRKHAAKGFCNVHYVENKRNGTLPPTKLDVDSIEYITPRSDVKTRDGQRANMYCDEEECMNEFVGTLPISDNICPVCGSDKILLSKYQDDI